MDDQIAPGHLARLVEDLAAAAARAHGGRAADRAVGDQTADNADLGDASQLARRVCAGERDGFGAQRQPVAGIFEIAPCDDRAVVEK